MSLPNAFDLRALEIFVAVVRAEGMSAAARSLGVSQSAVSQSIAGLERALNTELFDRSLRPPRLTPTGKRLYRHAVPLIAQATNAVREVRDPTHGALPVMRIAMADSVAFTIGPELVTRFAGVAERWEILSGLSIPQKAAFLAGQVDMLVLPDERLDDHLDLECHELFHEPFLIAVPAEYRHLPLDLDHLIHALRFVRYSLGSNSGVGIERHLRELHAVPPPWLEIDSPLAQLSLVASGQAWALMTPLFLLQAPHLWPRIQLLNPPIELSRAINMITRSGYYGDLPERIARCCRTIMADQLLPPMQEAFPRVDVFADDGCKYPYRKDSCLKHAAE